MKSQTLIAPAKINLALDVVGRREDGYHLLWTVMQSIALADRVMVEVGPDQEGIKITCGAAGIPSDERNTAWRAARLFMDAAKIQDGVHITLEKTFRLPRVWPAAAAMPPLFLRRWINFIRNTFLESCCLSLPLGSAPMCPFVCWEERLWGGGRRNSDSAACMGAASDPALQTEFRHSYILGLQAVSPV